MIDDKIREIEDMLFTYKDYCNINQRNNKYNDVFQIWIQLCLWLKIINILIL